jgi:hypothetical protein
VPTIGWSTHRELSRQEYDLGLFFQPNKPFVGEARHSSSNPDAAEVALSSR